MRQTCRRRSFSIRQDILFFSFKAPASWLSSLSLCAQRKIALTKGGWWSSKGTSFASGLSQASLQQERAITTTPMRWAD